MNIQPVSYTGRYGDFNVKKQSSPAFLGNLRRDVFIIPKTPLERLKEATGTQSGAPVLSFFDSVDKVQENLLNKYNIKTDFGGNKFVANCTQNAADLMASLISPKHLPNEVKFMSFSKNLKGENQNLRSLFTTSNDGIYINSDFSYYTNLDSLAKEREKGHHYFFDNEFSTYNPLHGFVHDFAHAAHHKNLKKANNLEAWDFFADRELSKYEYKNQGGKMGKWGRTNLCEYMAEAITKDILTPVKRIKGKDLLRYEGGGTVQSIRRDTDTSCANFNTYNIWQGNTGLVKANLQHRDEYYNPQYMTEEEFRNILGPIVG